MATGKTVNVSLKLQGRVLRSNPKAGSYSIAWDMRAPNARAFRAMQGDVHKLMKKDLMRSRTRENQSTDNAMRIGSGAIVLAIKYSDHISANVVKPTSDDRVQNVVAFDRDNLSAESVQMCQVLGGGRPIWQGVKHTKNKPILIAMGLDNAHYTGGDWYFWLMVNRSVYPFVKKQLSGCSFLKVIPERKKLIPTDKLPQTITINGFKPLTRNGEEAMFVRDDNT